ncbi:hypothetical protein B0H16DRAFT_1682069 [Mycena metata]|uniref:SET domain-containing protein n=1 Tax=Mycena metata TaxID=1033252 RepID=A0AAD7KC02_9AGAR|nr:hypothetical protein B0H16DRAFT_1682069 [Mycena metata]
MFRIHVLRGFRCVGRTAHTHRPELGQKFDNHEDTKALIDPASPAYQKHPLWRKRCVSTNERNVFTDRSKRWVRRPNAIKALCTPSLCSKDASGSGMKRGFLNSSKAKARPLGPTNDNPNPKPASSRSAPGDYKPPGYLPFGKIDKIHVPLPENYDASVKYRECDGRSGTLEDGTMTFTTVPWGVGPDEPVSECFFFPGSKEVLMKLPGFQPLLTPAAPAFHMVPMAGKGSGKGSGLVSTRALRLGDLILDERPLFVAARGVPAPFFAHFSPAQTRQHEMDQLEKYFDIGMQRIRPENKNAFMALANSHKEDGSGPIFGRASAADYCSSVHKLMRSLTSCSPNTAPRFNMSSFSYRLYALRDIAEGEELTFQYTDVSQPAAQRNERLRPYGFVCDCAACKDATASDARRKKIGAFGVAASCLFDAALADDTRMDNFLAECHEHLALIAQEGVEHFLAYFDIVKLMMEAHIWRKDTQKAGEWAEKLNKFRWDENWEDMTKYIDPASRAYEAHPFWRKDNGSFGGGPRNVQQMLQQMVAAAGKGHAQIVPGAGAIFY